MIDLDELERMSDWSAKPSHFQLWHAVRNNVPALLAEVRAARKWLEEDVYAPSTEAIQEAREAYRAIVENNCES